MDGLEQGEYQGSKAMVLASWGNAYLDAGISEEATLLYDSSLTYAEAS